MSREDYEKDEIPGVRPSRSMIDRVRKNSEKDWAVGVNLYKDQDRRALSEFVLKITKATDEELRDLFVKCNGESLVVVRKFMALALIELELRIYKAQTMDRAKLN